MYRLIVICFLFLFSIPGFGQVPITNLQAWYSADSVLIESDYVKQLYDISGNGHHLIQNNLINRPSQNENAFAGHPTILFDGSNDFLSVDFNDTIEQSNTIIIAWKINTQKAQAVFDGIVPDKRHSLEYVYSTSTNISMYAGGVGIGYSFDKPLSDFLSVNTLYYKTLAEVYDNGSFVGSSSIVGAQGLSGFNLGSRQGGSRSLSGEIAEVLIYNDELPEEDRLMIEAYLMDKYSPPVDLGDDILFSYGFCDTTIYLNGNYSSVLWSTGDTSDSIVVNSSGQYWVEVTDAFGRISSDSIIVSYPEINVSNYTVCFGDSVMVKPMNSFEYSYLWSTGSAEDSVFVSEEGDYNVQIFDSLGCSYMVDFSVQVDSFSIQLSLGNDTALCVGNQIGLILGNELVDSYLWSPGGDTTDYKRVLNEGYYSLLATNGNGCTFNDSIFVTILGTAPTPNFNLANLCYGDSTTFTDLSTPQNDIASWQWVFNENDTLNDQNAKFLFEEAGSNIVELDIESFAGCSNDTSFYVEIFNLPEVSYYSSTVCVNVENRFLPVVNIPENDSVVLMSWDVDDVIISESDTLSYTFDNPGEFELSLTVETENGCSNVFTKTITVFDSFENSEISLLAPTNGITLEDTIIVFDWQGTDLDRYYQLIISSDSLFQNTIYSSNELLASTDTVIIPSSNDTLYWRVAAYNHCLDLIYSEVYEFEQFNINEYGHLIAWYTPESAQDSNGFLYSWIDRSGNSYNIVQANEDSRPQLENTSLYPFSLINYDGNDDYLTVDFGQTYNQPLTGFVIWQNSIRKNQNIFDGISPESLSLYFPYSVLDVLFYNAGTVSSIQYEKTVVDYFSLNSFVANETSHLFYNGSEIGSGGNIGSNGLSGITFGSRAALDIRFFNGQIQEFILFDGELSDSIRIEIESYLHDKYFPPVNLERDISIPYGFPDTAITTADKPWFTSYQWSTYENDTLSSLTVSESGTYAVTVTDVFGFESADSLKVRYPKFNLWESRSICLGDTLIWDLDAKGPYSYEWSTGATDTAIQVFEAGTYNVTLTDTMGNQWSPEPVVITIDSFPVKATLGPDLTLCDGNRLELEVGQDEAVDFLWHDGSSLPYYRINETEEVSVRVINNLGCVAFDTIHVDVAGTAPKADFNFGTTCRDFQVQFTDLSETFDGSVIQAYGWDFGSYGSSSLQNPEFAFPDTGMIEVTLFIETNVGCDNDTSLMLNIHELPVANFSNLQACENATVQMNNTSFSADGEIESSLWLIGDDVYSVDNPIHIFDIPGAIQTQLVVSTEFNCSDTMSRVITIKPAPEANFSYNVACLGEPVYFTNLSTANLNQQFVSQWQFGDLGSSGEQNPFFVFDNLESQNVKLIVRQLADGCTDTLSQIIQIHNLPEASVPEQTGCEGMENILNHNSSWGEGEGFGVVEWQFADTILTGDLPVYNASEAGTYDLLVRVKNAAGCVDTVNYEYVVNESPVVGFAPLSDTTFFPTSIALENTSDPVQWSWFVNDNQFSTDENPVIDIDSAGLYVIMLRGLSDEGCENMYIDSTLALTPFVDGGIMECRSVINEGRLYVSVDLVNLGTKRVTNPELRLTLSNGQMFAETFAGNLYPGDQETYTFRTQYFIPENVSLRWLIVDLEYAQDQASGNNECMYVFGDKPVIYPPYPNPASAFINLDFTASQEGSVKIVVYNLMGRIVLNQTRDASEGLNRFEIPNPAPSGGVHTMEVEVNGKRQTFRIIL